MRVRKCWVETCESSANRVQDKGVTFHKLPKNEVLCKKWLAQSRLNDDTDKKNCLICSRHFRRADFEPFKASIFALKLDAIPTIFSWGITSLEELNNKFPSLQSTNQSNVTETNAEKEVPNIIPISDIFTVCNNKNSINTSNLVEKKSDQHQENPSNMETCSEIENKDSTLKTVTSPVRESVNEVKSVNDNNNDLLNILSGNEKESTCQKNIEEQVPEIETIFENLFEKQNSSINNVLPNDTETNEAIEDFIKNKTEVEVESNKSLKSEFIKDSPDILSKSCTKITSVGRPRRSSPLNQKSFIRSKSKLTKQKLSISKYSHEEKTTNSSIKPDKGMLVPGSRVEVKDYNDIWYSAKVVEVDHEEMEVLIHYDNWSQRFDEWIYMWSPRIRIVDPNPPSLSMKPLTYKEGERCLARWSNNQRFPATVQKVLPNGQYEVVFDDGFVRTTKSAMMSKLNSQSQRMLTTVSSLSNATPVISKKVPVALQVPQQNHLFDPNRDHLGTKEERRNLKKKIDVKELFFVRKKRKENIQHPANNKNNFSDDKLKKRKLPLSEEDSKDAVQNIKKKIESHPQTDCDNIEKNMDCSSLA